MPCDVDENNADPPGYATYLLDLKADLLSQFDTRVVMPLIRADRFARRGGRLHPTFDVLGKQA